MRSSHLITIVSLSFVAMNCTADFPAKTTDGGTPSTLDGGTVSGEPDSGSNPPGNDGGGGGHDSAVGSDSGPIGGDRPAKLHVPPDYSPDTPMPLVLMLHGYGSTAQQEETYLKMSRLSDSRKFLYVYPEGRVDTQGYNYWNATDACCGFGARADDSGYLAKVIADIKAQYNVDNKRVFIFGHSNGGFMAYRMACDHADQIAAIVSLEGAMFSDISRCNPSSPVNTLEIHGTADDLIRFNGGDIYGVAYPSAATTVAHWISLNGCSNTADTSSPDVDVDSKLAGNETSVTKYGSNCQPGGYTEFWKVVGGQHVPTLSSTFTGKVIDFFFAHPKP